MDADPKSPLQEGRSSAFHAASCSLFLGDCREMMERHIPSDSVSLSVWSPPYCVGKEYERGVSYDEWANMLADVLQAHARILKPGGFCAVTMTVRVGGRDPL
jgi:DNA modification methylase